MEHADLSVEQKLKSFSLLLRNFAFLAFIKNIILAFQTYITILFQT